jgi:hypothetical protein
MKQIFYNQITLDQIAKDDAMTAAMDPFGGIDSMEKYSHHFEEGQRVRIKADNRRGKIESINGRGHLNVKLDSGHLVECVENECEPADFPSTNSSGATLDRAQKGGSLYGGLIAAMENGTISDQDRVIVSEELRKYDAGEGVVDPFGGIDSFREVYHDPRLEILGVMAEKYVGAAAEPLEKRKKDSGCLCKAYRVGQSVRDRQFGSVGKITRVDPRGAVDVDFGGGNSTSYIQCENSLEAVEAA